MHRVPLRNRAGVIVAHALLDDDEQAKHRWCLSGSYAVRSVGGRIVFMHREVLGLTKGDGLEADHINQNKLDNRRANLRTVTRGQNKQNLSSYVGSTSNYRGVSWDKHTGKWRACVTINRHRHHLGYFADESAAADAAADFRAEHMPFSEEARA